MPPQPILPQAMAGCTAARGAAPGWRSKVRGSRAACIAWQKGLLAGQVALWQCGYLAYHPHPLKRHLVTAVVATHVSVGDTYDLTREPLLRCASS